MPRDNLVRKSARIQGENQYTIILTFRAKIRVLVRANSGPPRRADPFGPPTNLNLLLGDKFLLGRDALQSPDLPADRSSRANKAVSARRRNGSSIMRATEQVSRNTLADAARRDGGAGGWWL